MKKANLTTKQQLVLRAVWDYWQANNIGPRLRDLSDELEISGVSVHGHLCLLQEKGFVSRERFASRAVWVTAKGRAVLGLRNGAMPINALRLAWSLASKDERARFLKEVMG